MYNVLKNNNILNNKNSRLIYLNNNHNNIILSYIILSFFKNRLSNINYDDINIISNYTLKELNNYTKKNYKINKLNLSNNEHLNIIANLYESNLVIYKNNLNDIKFKSFTGYNNTIKILLKNKKYYLIAKNKNEFNFIKKFNLCGGAPNNSTIINPIDIIPNYNIGLWNPQKKSNNWYNIKQVNNFLLSSCLKIINSLKNKDKFDVLKEINIAAFTNLFRDNIYKMINDINIELNEKITLKHKEITAKLVLSGGDCFNSLINDNTLRPISPDIDVKLIVNCLSGDRLHNNHMNKIFDYPERKSDIINYNIILIKVTNIFNKIFERKVNELNNTIDKFNESYIEVYGNLTEHCNYLVSVHKNSLQEVILLKYKLNKKLAQFRKRYNFMESGYTGYLNESNVDKLEVNYSQPFRINNVILYSIDGIFEGVGETSFTGINGMLDVVVSLPTHHGYMVKTDYTQYSYNNINNLFKMTKDFYINYDNLKLVKFGLREVNKKIIKDFQRIYILFSEDTNLQNTNPNVINYIINKIKELINNDNFKSDINELNKLLQNFICINKEGGYSSNNTESSCNRLATYSPHFDLIIDKDEFEIKLEMDYINNIINQYSTNNKFGGSDFKFSEISYRMPKALYFLISSKIIYYKYPTKALLKDNPGFKKYVNKFLISIKNYNNKTINLKEKGTNYVKLINYEELTQLTEGDASKRSEFLSIDYKDTKPDIFKQVFSEAFSSDAFYRFNNLRFRSWTENIKIINTVFNEIIAKLNKNVNDIHKLYYFDVNMSDRYIQSNNIIIEDYVKKFIIGNFNNFQTSLNANIAQHILHTFMPIFNDINRNKDSSFKYLNKYNSDIINNFYQTIVNISNMNQSLSQIQNNKPNNNSRSKVIPNNNSKPKNNNSTSINKRKKPNTQTQLNNNVKPTIKKPYISKNNNN
jgi:hypothetical protein